jgi:hypothetical protein
MKCVEHERRTHVELGVLEDKVFVSIGPSVLSWHSEIESVNLGIIPAKLHAFEYRA